MRIIRSTIFMAGTALIAGAAMAQTTPGMTPAQTTPSGTMGTQTGTMGTATAPTGTTGTMQSQSNAMGTMQSRTGKTGTMAGKTDGTMSGTAGTQAGGTAAGGSANASINASADVSDEQVNEYATAVAAVQKVQGDAALSATDKQTQMADAVKASGLQPKTFNDISRVSQSDPALMKRIQTAFAAQTTASGSNQ